MEQNTHVAPDYLLSPQHPVTVNVIGCGGTGSQVINNLARINCGLKGLNHPGIFVRAYDGDEVSEANIGRQMYSPMDVGANKSAVLISRINRFFGFQWQAQSDYYTLQHVQEAVHWDTKANITITCVDSAKARIEIGKALDHLCKDDHDEPFSTMYYWLDHGNSRTKGQVILGTLNDLTEDGPHVFDDPLPTVLEEFPDIEKHDTDEDQGPSCSLAEALNSQDLFINSTLAQYGCNMIWKLFREIEIKHRGIYVNLDTLTTNPIEV